MNIVVTVKQVPDPNTPTKLLTIDARAKRVIPPAGIPPVMNGYDANALEEAVRLKEQRGAKVTAVSVGDDGARDALRRAIAMGASEAIHVEGAADLDSSSTAEVLAAAIARLAPFDLMLCGRQASDTDGGQVLFGLAELLGLPAVSPIKKIVEVQDGALVVDRIIEDGTQRVRVELPALLGVSSEVNQPRYPAMKGVLIAKRAEIPTWRRGDLALGDRTPGRGASAVRRDARSADGAHRGGLAGRDRNAAGRATARGGADLMGTVLVVGDAPRGKLRPQLFRGGRRRPRFWPRRSGARLSAALVGQDLGAAADAFLAAGMAELYVVDSARHEPYVGEEYAAAGEAIIGACSPGVALFPHTLDTREWVARLAARRRTGLVTDCVRLAVDDGSGRDDEAGVRWQRRPPSTSCAGRRRWPRCGPGRTRPRRPGP